MRFRQVEADQRAAADAAGAQPVRDLVGELVELLVAQCFPERLDGRPQRTARDLGFEELVQEDRLPDPDSRGTPLRADVDECHFQSPAPKKSKVRLQSSSWVQGSGLAGIVAVPDGKAHQLSPISAASVPPTATAT